MKGKDALPEWKKLNNVDVPCEYKSLGCRIEETHRRGISIHQLETLARMIQSMFKNGFKYMDNFTKQPVTLETINLYHMNDLFIRPLTKEYTCSFVELVASRPQEPEYFVSHWWGTPFMDTVRMLKLHRKERGLNAHKGYYWICAFANNQHNLEELNATKYLDTPFARAIMSNRCKGTVIVLNEKEAKPFERSWCIFEAFISTTHGQKEKDDAHLLDIVTIVPEGECKNGVGGKKRNDRCAGLLKDLTQFEKQVQRTTTTGDGITSMLNEMTTDHPKGFFDSAPAWFPNAVAMHGIRVDIRKAEASEPSDRRKIMNWVGDNVHLVNHALRRRFIRAAMKSSCIVGNPEFLREAIESTLVPLKEDIRTAEELQLLIVLAQTAPGRGQDVCGCVRYLIEIGVDPNKSYGLLGHPVGQALQNKNYGCFRALVEGGADLRLLRSDEILSIQNVVDVDEVPKDVRAKLKKTGVLDRIKVQHQTLFCGCLLLDRSVMTNPLLNLLTNVLKRRGNEQ